MIIGMIGFIGSGKGTVAAHLSSRYGFRQDSFAASLKDACAVMFDWPRHLLEGDTEESREWREQVDPWWAEKLGNPNLTPRLALQLMGTDVIRDNFNDSMWFLTVLNRMRKDPYTHVVISDVRFPNEIKFIQENGGKLIRINRGPLPVWYSSAVSANAGNRIAKATMATTYSYAHFSEWAWAGSHIDFDVDNNSNIEDLISSVDKIISSII